MSRIAAASLALIALALSACKTATSDDAPLLDLRYRDRGITEAQVGADLIPVLRAFEGRVSWASHAIQQATSDPLVRRNAMQWRVLLVPAAQAAAFQPTPSRGLIDLWALVLQMQDYLGEGEGRALFGEQQSIALQACAEVREQIESLELDLPGADPAQIRTRIEEWAALHPISGDGYSRPSTASTIASLIGPQERSLGRTVRSIDDRIADLTERVTVYAGSLPTQSRWQAELVLDDMLDRPEFQNLFRDLAVTADSLTRLAELQDFLGAQVTELEEFAEAQRVDVLRDVERQRVDTLSALTEERKSILADVERQRLATLANVEQQTTGALAKGEAIADDVLASIQTTREQLVELVDQEHRRVFADTERLAQQTLELSALEARGLIDHMALRAVQGGAVLIVLFFLAAAIYRRTTR